MPGRTIVAETEYVTAIEQDFGGNVVFVTFNELGLFRNGDRFWDDSFFQRLGISSIGIVTAGPNWYPEKAMDEILPEIRRRISGRRVITYGHGQGGYGALKYANKLGASVALAFCPQWSIDPDDVGAFDTRYKSFFNKDLANGRKIIKEDLAPCSFVFYDRRMRPDAMNVQGISRSGHIIEILCPFTGHDTARLISEGGIAEPLMLSFAGSDSVVDAGQVRSLIRSGRKDSRTYYSHMRSHLFQRIKTSKVFLLHLIERFPGPESKFDLAIVAFLDGKVEASRDLLNGITESEASKLNFLFLSSLCRKVGFIDGEKAVSSYILKFLPNKTFHCLNAIETMVRTADFEAAGAELERLSHHDDAPDFIGLFVSLATKLKRPEVLEGFLARPIADSAKTNVMFALAGYYQERKDRQKAFKILCDLAALCQGSMSDLAKICQLLGKIGEWSYALDLRRVMIQQDPKSWTLRMDAVEAMANMHGLNREVCINEIKAVLASWADDPACWARASGLFDNLNQMGEAQSAIRKAISLSDGDLSYRYRLASLLFRDKKIHAAKAELRGLLGRAAGNPGLLRQAGNLAQWTKDQTLAMEFAEAQYVGNEQNPECILFLARCSRVSGDRSRALELLTRLFESEQRSPILSSTQWVRLAEELYLAEGSGLAKAASLEALAREPGNEVVKRNLASIQFLQGRAAAGAVPDAAQPKREPRFKFRLFR